VGVIVGVFVGVLLGVDVGVADGGIVGVRAGVLVGVAVGDAVGVCVGVLVGVLVRVLVGGVPVGAQFGTASVGTGLPLPTITAPSVPGPLGTCEPVGSSITTPLMVRVYMPGSAVGAMLILQVYRTEPSGIGLTFMTLRTRARIPVQAAPVQPNGLKPNAAFGLLMHGFTEQSGVPSPF
jgi:hypothetical protein